MPTGSKLIGALCLGILGFIVAELMKPQFPEGTYFGNFSFICTAIGLVLGWRILGKRATGGGMTDAINNGLTAVIAQVLVSLFIFSSYEMLDQSIHLRYTDLMEAMHGILDIGMGYAKHLATVRVASALLIGAVISGWLTEFAYRNWR